MGVWLVMVNGKTRRQTPPMLPLDQSGQGGPGGFWLRIFREGGRGILGLSWRK